MISMPRSANADGLLSEGGRFCFAVVHPMNSAGWFDKATADAAFVIEGSYQMNRFMRIRLHAAD